MIFCSSFLDYLADRNWKLYNWLIAVLAFYLNGFSRFCNDQILIDIKILSCKKYLWIKRWGIETVEEGLQQIRMPSKMIDGEFRLGLHDYVFLLLQCCSKNQGNGPSYVIK